jgi:hypothetical protein
MIQKDEVLKLISQEEIFQKYFPYSIEFNKKYTNPFRLDKYPGCEFKYSKSGVLYFIDWARRKKYDCFNVAQESTNEINFQKLLRKISKDFDLNLMPTSLDISKSKIKMNITKETNDYFEFQKKKKDTKYSYKISSNQNPVLKFYSNYSFDKKTIDLLQIYHLDFFQINDYIEYSYSDFPIFMYKFDDNNYQVYIPNAKNNRFYTVCEDLYLAGKEHLPLMGTDVVITSSYKDVGVYTQLNIPACCPLGEATPIRKEDMNMLLKRFDRIWLNYNNDEAGKQSALMLKNSYPNINFNDIINKLEKDPSDTVEAYGYDYLIQELKENGFVFR